MRLILIPFLLFASAVFADTELTSYTIYDETPAGHYKIVAGRTWDDPIAYNTGTRVDCAGAYTDTNSNCYFDIDMSNEGVPATAKAVKLLVKSKSWALTGPGSTNRCQIFGRVYSDSLTKNHFIHTETWGYGTEQRRDVAYTSVDANIVNGSVVVDFGREMKGQCITEVAIYLEGYYE